MKSKNEMGKRSWYSGIVLCVILGLITIGCGGGGSDSPTNSTTPTDTKTPTTTDTTVPPSTGSVNIGDGYLPLNIGNKWVYNVQEKKSLLVSGETTGCLSFKYILEIISGSGNKWIAKYEKKDSTGKIVEEGSINFDKKDGLLYKDGLILLPTEENQKIPGLNTDSLFYELGNDVFNVGMSEYTFNNNICKIHFSGAYDNGVISSWKGIDDEYHKGIGLFKFYSKFGGGGCTSFGCTFSETALTGNLASYTINGKQQDVVMEITSGYYVTAESAKVLVENVLKALKSLLTYCSISSESLSKDDLENILHSYLLNLFSEDDKARLQKLYTDFETFDSKADGKLSEEEISIALSVPSKIYIAGQFKQAKSADELIKNVGAALTGKYSFVYLIPIEIYRIVNTSLLTLFDETDQSRLRNLSDNFKTFDTDGDGGLYPEEVGDALSVPSKIYIAEQFKQAKSADELIKNAGAALTGKYSFVNLLPIEIYRVVNTSLLTLFDETDQSRLRNLSDNFKTFDTDGDGGLYPEEVGDALSVPSKIYLAGQFKQAKSADELIKNAGAALTGKYSFVNLIPIEIYRIVNTSLLTLFDETDQSRLKTLADNFDKFDTGAYDKGNLTKEEIGKALSIPVK